MYLVWYSDQVPYETKNAVISIPFTEQGPCTFQHLQVKKLKRKPEINNWWCHSNAIASILYAEPKASGLKKRM